MEDDQEQRSLITDFAKYNADIPALQFIRDDPRGVSIRLITEDGLVNYVFRVSTDDSKHSVIIKYGEETMRLLPEEKLTLERQTLEFNCLNMMRDIQPGSAPEPFCLDTQRHILAMSDMRDWELLGTQFERRHIDLRAPANLAQLLAHMHKETAKANLTQQQWHAMQQKYAQLELKEYFKAMSERAVVETDPINQLPTVVLPIYRRVVTGITQHGFLKKSSKLYNAQICFIHADCHHKAVFVKDGNTAIFDFEFAFLGHPAFNLALPLAFYIMIFIIDAKNAGCQQSGPSHQQFRHSCIQACEAFVGTYIVNNGDVDTWCEETPFLAAMTLFTGVLLFNRSTFHTLESMLGLPIEDADRGKMMEAGYALMACHTSIHSVSHFITQLTSIP